MSILAFGIQEQKLKYKAKILWEEMTRQGHTDSQRNKENEKAETSIKR